MKANVGTDDGLDHPISEVEKHFGTLDIMICNAASGYNRPALQQKPRGWDWTMNINARSQLFANQRADPLMGKRGGGPIVSISTPGSFHVHPDYVVVASKAALEALTRYLAVELAEKNIIVNAVSPGITKTEVLHHFDSAQRKDLIDSAISRTPAGRLVTPRISLKLSPSCVAQLPV